MEALAGLALAGNILQFLQLGQSILSKRNAFKRSQDGTLKKHKDLERIIADLDTSISKLDYNEDDDLRELIQHCKEAGKDLKRMLEKVAGKSKKGELFSSYRTALLVQWHEKDIEGEHRRFEALRQQTGSHIQILTKRDVATLIQHSTKIEQQVNEGQNELKSLAKQHQGSSEHLMECITSSRNAILSRCDAQHLIPRELIAELGELQKLCGELLSSVRSPNPQPLSSSLTSPSHEEFLQTFVFREMNEREESIPEALSKTYEWILEGQALQDVSPNYSHPPATEREKLQKELSEDLVDLGVNPAQNSELLAFKDTNEFPTAPLQKWLATGKDIFWIWGKPGCGKSTMMKAMLRNSKMRSKLETLLSRWGGRKTLIVPFFFFRPGMNLQKSQLGFLRATLYEILSQRRSTIDQIFSSMEQWQAVNRLKTQAVSECSVWTANELRRALHKWRACDDSDLYLHVDGIDEIDCEPLELANLLKELSALPRVKSLAAGRYHADFDFCFQADQKLNIHELTEPDILRFVIDKLNQSKLRELLDPEQRSQQFTKIVKEIASSAQGVFQWVNIVVDLVMQGVRRIESFERLFSRLREYPKDLDDLYWFLYRNIEPRYAADAALWLLVVFHSPKLNLWRSLDAYTMNLADNYNPRDAGWLATRWGKKRKGMFSIARTQQQRMQARCPHFFDFSGNAKWNKHIIFAHRTILDFLHKDGGAVLAELSRCSEMQSLPILSSSAAYILNSSSKFALDHGILDRELPTMICKLSEQGTLEDRLWLWNQLISLFTTKDPMMKYSRLIMPTTECWVKEDFKQTVRRLDKLKGGMLHLAALCSSTPSHWREISDASTALDLDYMERELLFVEYLCAEVWSGMRTTYGYQFASTLFPNGVAYNCGCLQRILELTRHQLFSGVIPTDMKRYGNYYLKAIHSLVSLGANPDTVCRGVHGDADLSQFSIKALLNRNMWIHHDKCTVKAIVSSLPLLQEAASELDRLLEQRGATEFTIPYEEHKEDPIEIFAQ